MKSPWLHILACLCTKKHCFATLCFKTHLHLFLSVCVCMQVCCVRVYDQCVQAGSRAPLGDGLIQQDSSSKRRTAASPSTSLNLTQLLSHTHSNECVHARSAHTHTQNDEERDVMVMCKEEGVVWRTRKTGES